MTVGWLARLVPVLALGGCGNLAMYGGYDTGTGLLTQTGPEDCGDGVDNDGDGQLDCGDIDCSDTCDADGDGVDAEDYGGVDCDDDDPDVYPGADEVCDGVDSDCDGEDCDAFFEDFEAGTIGGGWTMGGVQPWVASSAVAHQGSYGAISGNVNDSQASTMAVTLDFPDGGTVEFWYKVNSEPGYDVLRFLIDGVLEDEWSGDVDWTRASYTVLPGTHTLDWRYVKDFTISDVIDAAAVDDVVAVGGALR